MKNNRLTWVLLITLGGCISFATSATAAMVTNDTTGTILFEDNFEGVPAFSGTWADAAAAGNVASNDFDPIATTGWYTVNDVSTYDVQVCSGADGFDPGPFEGDNYLRIGRSAGFCSAYLNFSPQDTLGDIVKFESMVSYAMSTDQGVGFLGLYGNDTSGNLANVMYCIIKSNGALYDYYNSAYIYYKPDGTFTADGNDPAGATLLTVGAQGEWSYVAADYAVGADSYSLTVGDVTVSDIPVSTSIASVSLVRLCTGAGGTEFVYYDHVAVPEPSTIVLVLCGIAGLLFVRRR